MTAEPEDHGWLGIGGGVDDGAGYDRHDPHVRSERLLRNAVAVSGLLSEHVDVTPGEPPPDSAASTSSWRRRRSRASLPWGESGRTTQAAEMRPAPVSVGADTGT